jgi:glycosyltransferase involved in cell wall biosynthesis
MTDLSIDDFQTDPGAQQQFAADIRTRNTWVSGARHIVTPSEYLRGMVEGWGVAAGKITVIQNGAAQQAATAAVSRRAPGEPLRVLFVGRLTNWKGVETLLLAAQQVPELTVEIAGDGPQWPALTALSRQLCLGDRVTFHGRLPAAQVHEAMGRAHVLVLTSLYEGLSHTILEAGAAGLPCVVSDRGGNREVVSHGHNGLLVPPQQVRCLAEALRSLARDEAFRQRLAAAAVTTARTFDLADTVRHTEQLLLKGER